MRTVKSVPAPLSRRSHFTLAVSTLSAAAGITAVFMPLAFDSSIVEMIWRSLNIWRQPLRGIVTESLSGSWRLWPSVVLPLIIVAGFLRWRFLETVNKWELRAGIVLGVAAALSSLSLYTPLHWRALSPGLAWPLTGLLLFLGVGVLVALRSRGTGIPHPLFVLVSLEMVFAGTAAAVLIDVRGHWQPGALSLLVAALLYTVQTLAVLLAAPRHSTTSRL